MKKFLTLAASALIFSLGMCFTSCGETVNVAGKHFEFEEYEEIYINFDTNSNKVFFCRNDSGIDAPENEVGTYTVEKNDVLMKFKSDEIRLNQQGKYLYLYDKDESGNTTNKIVKDLPFVENGSTDFFTNVFANTTQEINGVKVAFSENEASTDNAKVGYSFNSETAKYELAGFKPTYSRGNFLNNVFQSFLDKTLKDLNISGSTLTYEEAWLFRNKTSYVKDDLAEIWAKNYFKEDYEAAKNDDFARHNVIEKAKQALLEKFNSLDFNETFLITKDATVGKYDFSKKAFSVNSDLKVPEMYSTLTGESKPILPKMKFGNSQVTGLLEKLWLTMDEEKAAEFNKINNADSKYLAVIEIQPVNDYDDWGEVGRIDLDRRVRTRYVPYYKIKSIKLLDNNLKIIGNVIISER